MLFLKKKVERLYLIIIIYSRWVKSLQMHKKHERGAGKGWKEGKKKQEKEDI